MNQAPLRQDLPPLAPGEAAPWFHAPALSGSPRYAFDTVAGRHVLMLFLDGATDSDLDAGLGVVQRARALFDDVSACFFGVSTDPALAQSGRIAQQLPGIRFFLDYQRQITAAYRSRAQWVLLDPGLRVVAVFPIDAGEQAIRRLQQEIANRPSDSWAPVLSVPNVFPPELCRELIAGYEREGGTESGFMRQVDGKTVLTVDKDHKQRRDWTIGDQGLQSTLSALIGRSLKVPIQRAFQFHATRIERYIVACYEAGAGHFRPHRDNTTSGTAHRRFAVTINLNADDYDGGDLRFPEFGDRTYRAPTGGAIVFSCSLLHEATPVTRGRRFAFLPFLYDDQAARLREANNAHLAEGIRPYCADQAASGTS